MIQTSSIIWMECGRVYHLYWSCCNDSKVNFRLMKSCTLHRVLSPKGLQIKILIVGLNCNNHSLQFQQSQNISRSPFKMFKVPTLNKNKKEEDNNKKWKSFSVSLNRFELDDVIVSWRLLISQFWSFWSLQEYQRNMVYCN